MILFFYGEDTFRLSQKLRNLKEKFVSASLGETNLVILEGAKVSFEEIVRQILAMPFLSRKRLVIIENFLKNGLSVVREKVADFLKKVPETTVLVFVEEGNPDRRTALFRRLNLPGKTQEFKILDDIALHRWIRKEVANRRGLIEAQAVAKLVQYVGSDLWRMNNELAKLLTYQKRVTVETIDLLVQPQVQGDIFDLIQNTAGKNISRAMQGLYHLFNQGMSEIYILTMIGYQYRNLLQLKDAQGRNERLSSGQMARKLCLHPYVVTKTWPLLKLYPLEDLKAIYGKILNFETMIKTGKIEPRVGLELLIFELTR